MELPSITTNDCSFMPKPSLSSTLKNPSSKHKRRLRYEKFIQYSHLINRKYMQAMKNTLFRMHKQILKMKRRTNRIEQTMVKQTQPVQPVIRIERLTKGKLRIEQKEKGNFRVFFFQIKFQRFVVTMKLFMRQSQMIIIMKYQSQNQIQIQ